MLLFMTNKLPAGGQTGQVECSNSQFEKSDTYRADIGFNV
jgi:hypothetical protein